MKVKLAFGPDNRTVDILSASADVRRTNSATFRKSIGFRLRYCSYKVHEPRSSKLLYVDPLSLRSTIVAASHRRGKGGEGRGAVSGKGGSRVAGQVSIEMPPLCENKRGNVGQSQRIILHKTQFSGCW